MMTTMIFGPVKAGFEVLCGETEGAKRTMNMFSKTNPLVMPVRLVIEVTAGDFESARDTLNTFGNCAGNMACSTPLVGHTIAVSYGLAGNEKKAQQIFKQATRTTIVAGAGIVGSNVGPVRAIGFAAVVGVAWDLVDVIRGNEANGIVKLIETVVKNEDITPGELFDSMMVSVSDGMTGYAAAKTYENVSNVRKQNQLRQQVKDINGSERTKQFEDLSKKVKEQGVKNPEHVTNEICKQAKDLKQTVIDNETRLDELERTYKYHKDSPPPNAHVNEHTSVTMIDKDGNQTTGYSKRLTDASGISRFESETSKLEQNNPHIKSVMSRPLNVCAEHMAYEKISNPIRIYALQIKDGMVRCVQRCDNCKQFNLGNVLTDSLNGTSVPILVSEIPSPRSYFEAVPYGTILVAVADTKKPKRRQKEI